MTPRLPLIVLVAGMALSLTAVQAYAAGYQALPAAPQPSYVLLAESDKAAGAENFISGVADRGIAFLADESLTDKQREEAFRKLLSNSFDVDAIGRFSLGRYWREASDAQRKEYLGLFREMIIKVYSNRFNEYQGQQVQVTGSRAQDDTDTIVTSKLVSPGTPDVKVDWRVRSKGGQYKIIDVIVEGVSMALTQRSDFSSVIQRGGGDISVLIEHLRK